MTNSYKFGQFVLDPGSRTLSHADSPVFLTPKAFDVLTFLVQNPKRLVTKEELLQAVWGETFVEEGNLKQHISHLRKALGDNTENPHLIVTIARKGYQFTASVTVTEAADSAKRTAIQVPATENLRADTQAVPQGPAGEAVPKARWHWWKPSLLICCHFGGRGLYVLAALSAHSAAEAAKDHARRTTVPESHGRSQ